MPHRFRKEETCPSGLGRGNMPCRVREGETCPYRIREGETCPAGLVRGKYAMGDWLGHVRLVINAL